MTTLGVNLTSNDPTYTWADIKPTIHRTNPLMDRSERAYKLASRFVDEGRDQAEIDRMNWLGKEFQTIALMGEDECDCRPDPAGDHLCRVCRITVELMEAENY